ncbi:MAG: nuclear transport factor 2 family protein [Flavisolibacter sp.]|nr:nuclear transport factor 2 family protein [Flavisolibacter sp.]
MNTEIIKNIYSAFKAKDLNGILQLQAEDAEWSVAGPADKIPWAAPRHGHEGVADFLKVLGGLLVPEVFELHHFFENGDKVVALGFQKGYVRTNNKPYEFDFVHVWTVRDGKVSKFRVYYDTDYVASVLS